MILKACELIDVGSARSLSMMALPLKAISSIRQTISHSVSDLGSIGRQPANRSAQPKQFAKCHSEDEAELGGDPLDPFAVFGGPVRVLRRRAGRLDDPSFNSRRTGRLRPSGMAEIQNVRSQGSSGFGVNSAASSKTSSAPVPNSGKNSAALIQRNPCSSD
jgi:hypothetical protein